MTHNYAYSNYVSSICSKWDKGNDLYLQVTGDMCLTLN